MEHFLGGVTKHRINTMFRTKNKHGYFLSTQVATLIVIFTTVIMDIPHTVMMEVVNAKVGIYPLRQLRNLR